MNPSCIREVWTTNVDQEFAVIRRTIEEYSYIGMHTTFPGVVARPIGNFTSSNDYMYQTMRCNVDLLKVIQLGITLSDASGNHPPDICTWQFNFQFSPEEDMLAPDTFDSLRQAGFDFPRHQEFGIHPNDFAELLITSGLVLNPDTIWVAYNSGYAFGYFLKILTAMPLPFHESDFHALIAIWFPSLFDMKHIHRVIDKTFKGGIENLVDQLQVVRVGEPLQAGSESLLVLRTFFRMREVYFPSGFDENAYRGHIHGFGHSPTQGFGTGVGGASQSSALYNQQEQRSTPHFTPALQQQNVNHFARMGIPITSGGQ